MKEKHKLITTILKSGIITWILLLAVWNFGALFYTDDFLPGPLVTLKGMAAGRLFHLMRCRIIRVQEKSAEKNWERPSAIRHWRWERRFSMVL